MLALMMLGAGLARPDDLRIAMGVAGGGALVAFSYLAVRDGVSGLVPGEAKGEAKGPWGRRRALVKFFTRHAILALAAYGMMMRLHLDPVGMLVGVSAPVVAAGVEAVRSLRRIS